MKLLSNLRCSRGLGLLLALLLAPWATAFPPALPHLIYGMARDEYGNPLAANATITLTTAAGVPITCKVNPAIEPGVNYRLVVPMDSGISPDAYKTNALRPSVAFRIRVVINNTSFLPIEMAGDYSSLGQPGKQTRLNLTLGEDANRNGLPDAWERALIAARGWDVTLADLSAGWRAPNGGATLLQEYVAGTYGFADANGLNLKIARFSGGAPVLEFMAVRGRSYSIVSSADLKTWNQVSFRLAAPGADQSLRQDYLSSAVQLMQVAVPAQGSLSSPAFFKLVIR